MKGQGQSYNPENKKHRGDRSNRIRRMFGAEQMNPRFEYSLKKEHQQKQSAKSNINLTKKQKEKWQQTQKQEKQTSTLSGILSSAKTYLKRLLTRKKP